MFELWRYVSTQLRQLLTSAFDDDLSDEESVMSQDNDVSRLSHGQGVPTIQQEPGCVSLVTVWPHVLLVVTLITTSI